MSTSHRAPSFRSSFLVMPLIAVALMSGCTPWATYPPIEGAMGLSSPDLTPLPDLMSDAIWFTYQSYGDTGPIAVNLPPDTPPKVYDMVVDRLGGPDTAFPMSSDDLRAYTIVSVSVRTVDAKVVLIHPLQSGEYAESEVEFKQNLISGWYATRQHRWGYDVERPVANYVPPPGADTEEQWAEATPSEDETP